MRARFDSLSVLLGLLIVVAVVAGLSLPGV